MPIEGKFGAWLTDALSNASETGEIDLGYNYEKVLVMVPAISSGTITVHISNTSVGTFYPMYILNGDATGDFAHATTAQTNTKAVVFNIGGARYIKVVFGASQTLTVTVRGIK